MPATLATIVGTGLLGGYTTFSTVSVETVLLAERGKRTPAVANVIGTLALALLAATLGVAHRHGDRRAEPDSCRKRHAAGTQRAVMGY